GAAYVGMRHRVVVLVEPDIGCLADLDLYALDDGIGVVGEAEQQWRLLGEDLADAAGGVFRAAAITGQAAAPGVGLRVEVIEVGERAGGEEGVAHEPNGFF